MSHKDERRKSRQDRLGAALRQNLRRRKAQARGQGAARTAGGVPAEEAGPAPESAPPSDPEREENVGSRR